MAAAEPLVLCYHALSERWPAELSVTPRRFERQLNYLLRRGYRGTTVTEALREPRRSVVAVTFDDGYRSVLEHAFPILARIGWPATVFVVTEFVGGDGPLLWPGIDRWLGGPHEPELAGLSWAELRMLVEAGWEIGSHTCTHPRLTRVDAVTLERELVASRAHCQRELGRDCTALAYPYGDHDTRVVDAAGRAGYRFACTLPARLAPGAALAWPRVGVYHDDGEARFRAKVSPLVRRLRRSDAWQLADTMRRAVSRRGGSRRPLR